MSSYSFRLRFNFSDAYRIGADTEELIIWAQENLKFKLKSCGNGIPLKESSRAAILGGEFSSQEHAQSAAEQTKRAILVWSVEQRVGIDFGEGKQRGNLMDEGIKYFEGVHGRPIRLDKHGIDFLRLLKMLALFTLNLTVKLEKTLEL